MDDVAKFNKQRWEELARKGVAIVNGLIDRGLSILGLWEQDEGDESAEPGTWDHFKSYARPWLTVWARLTA